MDSYLMGRLLACNERKARRIYAEEVDLLPIISNDDEYMNLLMILNSASRPSRHVYRYLKANNNFWDRVLLSWDNVEYKRHLRLQKETFDKLCEQLRPVIAKKNTHYGEPIAPDCRLAVGLWRLATGTCYREIAETFGLGKSTVFMITMEICSALTQQLGKYVKLPSNTALAAQSFGVVHSFLNCVGAIDGTHITIPRPALNGDDYFNRKGRYSINMQAVVDYKGRFIDIVIGWPGKAHDGRVLANSDLNTRGDNGTLFPQSDLSIGGQTIPYYIIGDAAYPLKTWLMKPYPRPTTHAEISFNHKLSKARMVVERAFGRLKTRWRCLLHSCNASPANARQIIAACVVLHNFCDLHGDVPVDEESPTSEDEVTSNLEADNDTGTGNAIRDALRDWLADSSHEIA